MISIKNEPHPAKGTARIDNRSRLNPDLTNIETKKVVSNSGKALQDAKTLSNSLQTSNDPAHRDAQAMVLILNKMRSGFEPFEIIYDSLKTIHGKAFENHFRDILTGRDGA